MPCTPCAPRWPWPAGLCSAGSWAGTWLLRRHYQRLAGLLANLTTSEAQDGQLLQAGGQDDALDWRQRLLVIYRLQRKRSIRQALERLEGAYTPHQQQDEGVEFEGLEGESGTSCTQSYAGGVDLQCAKQRAAQLQCPRGSKVTVQGLATFAQTLVFGERTLNQMDLMLGLMFIVSIFVLKRGPSGAIRASEADVAATEADFLAQLRRLQEERQQQEQAKQQHTNPSTTT